MKKILNNMLIVLFLVLLAPFMLFFILLEVVYLISHIIIYNREKIYNSLDNIKNLVLFYFYSITFNKKANDIGEKLMEEY